MLAIIKVVILGWACHLVAAQEPLGLRQTNPGSSCSEIYEINTASRGESGYYWVNSTAGVHTVHCDMELECGGRVGGWMRIANLDAANSEFCPSGWSHITDPVSACIASDSDAGCHSSNFSTFGIPYSKVCGMAVGIQDSSTDGFAALHFPSRSINGPYVDGLSITYGTPRRHVWTYGIGNFDARSGLRTVCPCAVPTGELPPSFVHNNYYCESGRASSNDPGVFMDDPVWDGEGCPAENSCCSNPSLPWFFRQIPLTTGEDIETRICRDEAASNEDILITQFQLYVQ